MMGLKERNFRPLPDELSLEASAPKDFSPIEEVFSKIKGALRRAQVRTREALIEALGVAISAVTAREGPPSNLPPAENRTSHHYRKARLCVHHSADRPPSL